MATTKAKPPTEVLLGPYTIPVKFDLDAMTAASANGAYMGDLSTVMMAPNNSDDVTRDTLLHELLHAIWNQTVLVKKYNDADADSEGELIIAELAPRILELLRRNPDLVRYLLS